MTVNLWTTIGKFEIVSFPVLQKSYQMSNSNKKYEWIENRYNVYVAGRKRMWRHKSAVRVRPANFRVENVHPPFSRAFWNYRFFVVSAFIFSYIVTVGNGITL